MNIPERLIRILEEGGVAYRRMPHTEAFTAQEHAEAEHVKGRKHAKVVIVKGGEELMMAVLPSDRLLDLEKFEAETGKAAELASEDEFRSRFPDCELGAIPPFGGLYGMETYVDANLADEGSIVFEAGTRTDAIRIPYRDFGRLEKPMVVDIGVKLHSMKAA